MKVFALHYFDGEYSRVDPFDRFQIRANAMIVDRMDQIGVSTLNPPKCRSYADETELGFDLYAYLTSGKDRIWDSKEIEIISVSLNLPRDTILGAPREITPKERAELSQLLAEDEEKCTDAQLFNMRLRFRAWDEIDAIAKERRTE